MRLAMFLQPREFWPLLSDLASERHPRVVVEKWRPHVIQIIALHEAPGLSVDRLWIATEATLRSVTAGADVLDRHSICIDVPRIVDGRLQLCVAACDGNSELRREFARIKRGFSRHLEAGVTGSNVHSGASVHYRDIWFSAGAAAFHADGGEWVQHGVRNSRFAPPRSPGPLDTTET